jgi:MFS transporter, NNP family, nitrate/nitrite transporter
MFITGIFLFNFLARAIFSPLMLAIEAELHLSHAQAGIMFLMVSFGYSLALVGSGYLSSRLSHRHCVALAGYWMGLGLILVSLARSDLGLQFALFFFGISGGIYLPSGMAALTSLVQAKDYGKAIAVHELAPNLSLFLAPLLAAWLLPHISWRGVLGLLGASCLIISVFFHIFGKGGQFKGKKPNFGMVRSFLGMPAFWVLSLLFSLGVGGSMGPYSMLPLFLVDERGLTQEWANQLLALSRVACPFAAFAAGWAVDRLGPIRTINFYLLFTGTCTILLGVAQGHWLTAMVLLQPLFAACFFTAGFASISLIFPKDIGNVAISLIIPFGVLGGMGIIPTGLGAMGDMKSFGLGFSILGGVISLGMLLTGLLRKPLELGKTRDNARHSP